MVKTQKITLADFKTEFPSDFRKLIRVYSLANREEVDISCIANNGFIYCGSDLDNDLDYYIEYLAFDEARMNECLNALRKMYKGYDDYFYKSAVGIFDMEVWYNDHREIIEGYTYHQECMERVAKYFAKLNKKFKDAVK